MNFLRQSTAVDIAIGPFIDDDGITPATGLTITQAETRLKKNNGAWAQASDATSATHEEEGWYEKELDATDTNTCGILIVAVYISGNLAYWKEFQVVEEAVYDALFAASAVGPLLANSNGSGLTEAGGTGDHLTAINLPNQTMDIVGNITGNLSGSVGSVTGAVGSVTGAVGSVTGAVGSVTGLTASDVGAIKLKTDNLPSDPADASVVAGLIAAVEAKVDTVDTVVDAVKAKTDNLPTDPADASVIAGRFDTLDTSVADLPTSSELTTALGTADDAVLAAVATVDTVVDAIKVQTDKLTFTVANQLDANVQSINDVTITGDGQTGTEFGV